VNDTVAFDRKRAPERTGVTDTPRRARERVEIIGDLLASCTATGIDAGLRALSVHTGDRRYDRAARALFQDCPAGRTPIDDRAALREAAHILQIGKESTMRAALWRVARGRFPSNPEAALRRLQRKVKIGATK
jgi:hypothetical protein